MFTTIGVGIATIFKSTPGAGGGAFAYTAIDNSFSMEFDGVASTFNAGLFNDLDNGDLSACIWINTPNTRTVIDYVFGNDGATAISGFDINMQAPVLKGSGKYFIHFLP